MSTNNNSLELLFKVAQDIAKKNNGYNDDKEDFSSPREFSDESQKSDTYYTSFIERDPNIDMGADVVTNSLINKDRLLYERAELNIKQQKVLLIGLLILFGLQLLTMNIVVILVVIWSIFDFGFFKNIEHGILVEISNLTKYYVTAVLAELLSGIIFIVYKVFSYKD